MDRTIPSILGTGNGCSAFSPRKVALPGRHPEPAPPHQTPVPPNENRRGTTGVSQSNGERLQSPGYGCVLHADWLRRYSILQHRASQWGPCLVLGRRRSVVARKHQRDYANGWSIFDSMFGRPGTDQASSFSGALHEVTRAVPGSLCLLIHFASAFAQGVQRNVDDSGSAPVNS